jgi:hypothetical protein
MRAQPGVTELPKDRHSAAIASIFAVMLAAFTIACGSSPTQASATSPNPTPTLVASPTPDAVTLAYVALIKTYWIRVRAAEEATGTINVAARVCLGNASPTALTDLQLIDPKKCRERMLASLQVHQWFLNALKTTPAPPQFFRDDQIFRRQVPQGIADLKALISTTATGNKSAVLKAAQAYVGDFIPNVTGALDDVDPSVVHI